MPDRTSDGGLGGFYEELLGSEMAPLWEVLDRNRAPRPVTVPHRWAWSDVEPLLRRAGELVTAEEAERRVLMLVNPATKGDKRAVGNLYAGIQLILPGETARAHRHTAAALRFVLRGEGALTVVDGVAVHLSPFDLVVTPSWAWHDHVNGTAHPMVWLDALDSPLTRALDAWFFDPHPTGLQEPGDDPAREAALTYPWAPVHSAAVAAAAASDEGAAAIAYTHPATGADVLPTTRCQVVTVAAGGRWGPQRRVGGAVFCVAEGRGTAAVGPATFPLAFGDVFCVPSWCPLEISNDGGDPLSLFTYDDEPVLRAFGLERSEPA